MGDRFRVSGFRKTTNKGPCDLPSLIPETIILHPTPHYSNTPLLQYSNTPILRAFFSGKQYPFGVKPKLDPLGPDSLPEGLEDFCQLTGFFLRRRPLNEGTVPAHIRRL